jgi:hypothetical protein
MDGLTWSKRRGLWVVFVVLLSGLLVEVIVLLSGRQTARAKPRVIYVDAAASGGNGASWTDAFTTLQDALVVAGYGDAVWVAVGVYYPDEGEGQREDDRASTFELVPGVALYGGFPPGGGDGSFEARDWQTYPTVLSGDVDGNDGTDARSVLTHTASIDGANAYHVVTGDGVTETAVLDGFIITAGSANGAGGGMLYSYYTPIAIKASAVPSSENDVRVALVLTATRFATVANGGHVENTDASGGASGSLTVPADFVVSPNSDGSNPYSFEVVDYNPATGYIELAINVTSVSPSVDTTIYLVYGDDSVATSQEDLSGLWSGYRGVFHLSEPDGEDFVYDSTPYGRDAGFYAGPYEQGVDGAVGKACYFGGLQSGTNYGDYDNFEFGTDSFTFGAHVRLDADPGDWAFPVWHGASSTSVTGYCLSAGADSTSISARLVDDSGTPVQSSPYITSYGDWHHYIAVVDRANNELRLYCDGSIVGTASDISSVGDLDDSDYDVALHISYSSSNGIDGAIDEVQLIEGAADADWITTTTNNQADPEPDGDFWTALGTEQGNGMSTDTGGGMYNQTSSPTLNNVIFSGNQADSGGGMVNDDGSPTLTSVSFVGNTALDGGGMCNQTSSPTLNNVIFSGNDAEESGGGMYNADSSPMLANVTFSGNQASQGGGMCNIGDSSPMLVNSILWGNKASIEASEVYNDGSSTPRISYTDIEGSGGSEEWGEALGVDAGANIDADPQFVLPEAASVAPTTSGNYRLRYDSPAIDAGDTLSATTSADLDGNLRVVGEQVDMGAYEHQAYTLTVGQVGEGEVTEAPGWPTYTYLDQVTLTATADTGWLFDGWSGDVMGTDEVITHTIVGDTVVTATLGAILYTLETNIVGEGDVEVEPEQGSYAYGDVVTLTATADTGWLFDGWSGDVEGTDEVITHTIIGDTVVTATLGAIPYTLEVNIVGEGDVEVETEQESYIYGDVITLTAASDPGWPFVGWSGDVEGTDEVITHTIVGDTVVTATFEAIPYTLEVNTVGEGDVEVEPEQGSYVYGDVVTLAATADTGWIFDGWSGGVMGMDEVVTHTIVGDTVVTATFEAVLYTLEVNIVGEGDVEVEPDQDSYVYGGVVTLTATADPGWIFAGWSGDAVSTDNPLELTMEGDTAVTATFEGAETKAYLPLVVRNH